MIQAKAWWIWHPQFLQSEGLILAVNQRLLAWTVQTEILPRTELLGSSDNSQMCPPTWDWRWGLELRTSHDRQTCGQGCAYRVLHADKLGLLIQGAALAGSSCQVLRENNQLLSRQLWGFLRIKDYEPEWMEMTLCLKWRILQSVCHHLIFVWDEQVFKLGLSLFF